MVLCAGEGTGAAAGGGGVAVGREGSSKTSVVAAVGVMVMQQKRWIGVELMVGA